MSDPRYLFNVRPLGSGVFVLLEERDETPVGGPPFPRRATVLAVPRPGVDEDGDVVEAEVSVGDRVVLSTYTEGVVLFPGDPSRVLVEEEEILAVLEPVAS